MPSMHSSEISANGIHLPELAELERGDLARVEQMDDDFFWVYTDTFSPDEQDL